MTKAGKVIDLMAALKQSLAQTPRQYHTLHVPLTKLAGALHEQAVVKYMVDPANKPNHYWLEVPGRAHAGLGADERMAKCSLQELIALEELV